jgi:hypothetical protein
VADGADLETGLGDGDPVDEESACVGLVIVGDGDDPVTARRGVPATSSLQPGSVWR